MTNIRIKKQTVGAGQVGIDLSDDGVAIGGRVACDKCGRDAVTIQRIAGELYAPPLCDGCRLMKGDPRLLSEEPVVGSLRPGL
jgi:hypothetical protein